ncbi:hypothetical protein C8N32_10214 [Rhodovulum imhoffii]|uniref:Uncharacterized protein n=1 Tax=Rhodovulum imhoffii TaxID=365340 RepID=A0A2T5BV86_9RHOB|nr:hypothetical protein [Rhodovulum imhoffii]MBK5934260.1 hypothetical protein [Rhodovulum imhoffii]PTN03493.1 hypothetical protein C8N32_10214 [Rhodovulum imhoffii]
MKEQRKQETQVVPGHGGRMGLTMPMRLLISAQMLLFILSLEDEETARWLADQAGLSAHQAGFVELALSLVLLVLWGLCMIGWVRIAHRNSEDRK